MVIKSFLGVGLLMVASAQNGLEAQATVVSSAEPQGAAPSGPPPAMLKALAEHTAKLRAMCPPLPEMSAEIAAALPIATTEWGETGPSVVLIHGGVQGGLGGGPATFDAQQELGEQGWHVLRVFRPGFGDSPSRGPDDMEADAGWIADKLGNGANLIGHSWGGAESLLAAARRPEAVRSLVLVEPALELLAATDPSLGANPDVRAANMKRFGEWMASTTPAEYGLAFRRSVGAPATTDVTVSDGERQAADTRVGCAFLRAKMAPVPVFRQAVDAVVKAGIPVLVISGGWSPSFDLTGEIVARMLNGRHVIVPSPDHYVQQSNSAEFNRVVNEFMLHARPEGASPEAPIQG